MLFYAKQHARVAAPVMIFLIVVADVWANLRGIALGEMIRLDLPSLLSLMLGFTLIVSVDSVIYLVNWLVGFHPFLDNFDAALKKLFGRVSIPAICTGGLLAAFGEETFFRGVLQTEWGLVPTAIIFALAHVGRGFNLFAGWALLEGLLFGWLYQVTGNLLVPMVVHGLHDGLYMLFARFFFKRGIPPAATLFDWLVALSQPTTPPAPQADQPVEEYLLLAEPELEHTPN